MARLQSTLTIAFAILLAFSSTVRAQSVVVEVQEIVTVDPQQNTNVAKVTLTSTDPVAATAFSTAPPTTYTAPTITTTPTPTATPTPTPKPSSDSKGPSKTIIIAATVGGTVVLAAVIMGIYFCTKSQRKKNRRHNAPVSSEFFEPVAALPYREPTIPMLPDTSKGYRGVASPPPMQQRQSGMSGMSGLSYPEFQEDKRHPGYTSNELHLYSPGDEGDQHKGNGHSPPPGMHSPPPGMYSPPPEMHSPPPGMHSPPPGMHSPPSQFVAQPQEMEAPPPVTRHELQ